jgi:dihydroorotate dehydrogenase electron transfer subunit
MLKKVALLCKQYDTKCEVSLERYMKCGFGICGSCAIDGNLCCVDGTVFDGEKALSFKEFGNIARIKSGKEVSLQEYHTGREE